MSIAINDQAAELLQVTLSANNELRKNAEAELKRLSQFPGLALAFIYLIRTEEKSSEIRMAASLALKNFVRENWSGDGAAPLLEPEREGIKKAILESLFELPTVYRRQMSQTVCLIAEVEFPEKWPQLIEAIRGNMNMHDFDKFHTSLSTLEELVKRYRHQMRSNKLWSEINFVLGVVAEPLTQNFSVLLQYIPSEVNVDQMNITQRNAWLEAVLLSLKIYHSLVSQDLPEYFEDNLTPWMDGNLQLLKMKLPSIEQLANDNEANALDSIKCEVCKVTTLFSQRYEDCFGDYAQLFIGAIWNLLVETDSRIRFDPLVSAALGFLSAMCQRQHYAHHFQGEVVLQAICDNVIIKNLSLRREDLLMYQDEPFEFLKRDIEGSDAETRRRGATDFVRALCKQFEPQVFQILSKAIFVFLNDYLHNPAENYVKKDVVYYLVTAMASKTTTARYGATSTSQLIDVSDFYEKHVREDLLGGGFNCAPILCSDALKFLVLFRNQISPSFLVECFSGKSNQPSASIVHLLSSDHVLLHHYVGYAVERLLLLKAADGQHLLNSNNIPVKDLIEGLFRCLKLDAAYDTPYIMKALMRCFNIIDPQTASSAHIFVGQLRLVILQAIHGTVNPQVVHFVFESLCVLIRKAYTMVEGGLDKHVIPIIELIIPKDVVDLVPYALQVIALLLDQSQTERLRGQPVSQEQYLSFFPYLLRESLWSRSANIPALMLVFESFIACFPQVVFGSEYIDQVLGCYQHLIASKAFDQHGFRLASSFLNYIDVHSKLSSRNIFLPMLNRMQQLKTPKYSRQFVIFLCRFAIVKGGVALANALDSIQQGMYLMVVEKILVVEMKAMRHGLPYEEKRIITIGVASLIKDTVNSLGPLYGALVEGAVELLEAFDGRRISDGADALNTQTDDLYEEPNELEYSDPYCKLSYAQHPDTIGKEVLNIKTHLANAVLVNAYQVNPQSLQCLNAKVQDDLRAYIVGV